MFSIPSVIPWAIRISKSLLPRLKSELVLSDRIPRYLETCSCNFSFGGNLKIENFFSVITNAREFLFPIEYSKKQFLNHIDFLELP